jgi:ribosomal subunit interface protein
VNVDVTARGEVARACLDDARDKVGALDRVVNGPVFGARVVLTQERNPRIAQPARAEGEIGLSGMAVHARVCAESMPAAIDELAERLQRQLRRHIDHLVDTHRGPAAAAPGEWFHGAKRRRGADHFPRPARERQVVRRKSFAVAPIGAAEAAASMDALDHDFYLFHDVETDRDAVIYRRDDGRLALIEPRGMPAPPPDGPVWEESRISEPADLSDAVAEMDELEHRFLFFVNAATGRGNVLYLRYDGNYGLIEPAA